LHFFFVFQNICHKNIVFESFRWHSIPLGFMGYSFRTSKSKNDINYIKYQFSHRFGKVYRWLNMYYSNIIILTFLKITTMSIWIILKNLVWTYKKCVFCCFWSTILCIHPIRKNNDFHYYIQELLLNNKYIFWHTKCKHVFNHSKTAWTI